MGRLIYISLLFIIYISFGVNIEAVVNDVVTDVNVDRPDKKSIMMYVMCCYEVLVAKHQNNVRITLLTDI